LYVEASLKHPQIVLLVPIDSASLLLLGWLYVEASLKHPQELCS